MPTTTTAPDFSAHLRRLMDYHKMRRGDVARESGLTREALRKLERAGSDPKLSTLVKLARAFDSDLVKMLPEVPPDSDGLTPESVARLRARVAELFGQFDDGYMKVDVPSYVLDPMRDPMNELREVLDRALAPREPEAERKAARQAAHQASRKRLEELEAMMKARGRRKGG
jgi:transcriptional regulator with XRE-family HTH domain